MLTAHKAKLRFMDAESIGAICRRDGKSLPRHTERRARARIASLANQYHALPIRFIASKHRRIVSMGVWA
jgi:hypothetical protein